ncbi:MAG: glucose-6-phosphate isomerase [Rhizobiaceae bacterium]
MGNTKLTDFLEDLVAHRDRLDLASISALFDDDPERFAKFSVRLGTLHFDFSKNKIDGPAFEFLTGMAKTLGIPGKRDAMFRGDRINKSESRAALHTALRNHLDRPVLVNGTDVMPEIHYELGRMQSFCDQIQSGHDISDVVNIGIGGSDLGPRMVASALVPYHKGPNLHFVANVDAADLADTLKLLDPSKTLFIIASKTFTTTETMTNAKTALTWMEKAVGEAAADHFVAISSNPEATRQFGIPPERTFGIWDWVGGRYSVWSAIGLSVMLAVGKEKFAEFLEGAFAADEHFMNSEMAENIPVIMALLSIWHRNVCGYSAQAILPYDNRLSDFSRWMQQLTMESNGKSSNLEGNPVLLDTSPVIFGEPGTNGQHAFYQMIHQGTEIIPCDFLLAAKGHEPFLDNHHQLLVANCLAQSEALMRGRGIKEAHDDPHRAFAGDRPSNTLLYETLDPHTLGMLMALYEHKVFVEGALWNINSFDQWGVELGKELAAALSVNIAEGISDDTENGSTRGLLDIFFEFRKS